MAKAKTTKSTPKKATKKPTSTKKTTSKKSTTKKTTTAKSTSKSTKITKPKSTSMKTKNVRMTKIERADSLRIQTNKDLNKLSRISTTWTEKIKNSKTAEERKKINNEYGKKFDNAALTENASYKAYYDYVSKNFTTEQQKTAMKQSGDFMSKKYINALNKG